MRDFLQTTVGGAGVSPRHSFTITMIVLLMCDPEIAC